MFGVHLELNLFIAVDPRVHTPTWFSRSVEFKTENLEEAERKHWYGWERERSDARRKVVRAEESLQTETVIGLRPDQFLRYVEFERVASGLECGERCCCPIGLNEASRREKSPCPASGPSPGAAARAPGSPDTRRYLRCVSLPNTISSGTCAS